MKVGIEITIVFSKGIERKYTLSNKLTKKVINGEIAHLELQHPDFSETFIVTTNKDKEK